MNRSFGVVDLRFGDGKSGLRGPLSDVSLFMIAILGVISGEILVGMTGSDEEEVRRVLLALFSAADRSAPGRCDSLFAESC
jgi:hypothetical protein